jgi:mannose-6-phosphate isomerase-like protein (cupin superfamily)
VTESDQPVPRPKPEETVDPDNPWGTYLDVRFDPLERFDIGELVAANRRPWYNQSLSRVNDCVVRLGVIRGEFPWHRHPDEDEFFYVVEGGLEMDVEDRAPISLGQRQGVTVPRGVMHRPRADSRTVILMVEGASVIPLGDATPSER